MHDRHDATLSSEETLDQALVEAHKQASVEAETDAQNSRACQHASSSRLERPIGVGAAASACDVKKENTQKSDFALTDDHCGEDNTTLRNKDECRNVISPLLSRSEKLCVRHQRMADEDATARLQKVRLSFRPADPAGAVVVGRLFPTCLASDSSRISYAIELPRAKSTLEPHGLRLWSVLSRAMVIDVSGHTNLSLLIPSRSLSRPP